MLKKLFVFVFLSALLLWVNSCQKQYSELGEDSLYYIYNGQEYDKVTCYFHSGIQNSLVTMQYNNQDTLHLSFCVQTTKDSGSSFLHFNINHYHGQGKYYFDTNTGNNSYFTNNGVDINTAGQDTYIYILEIDQKNNIVRALFEGQYAGQNNTKHTFTKGRLDLHYSLNNQ